MKKILFVALTALALGLASVGVGAPTIAGGRVSGGGDFHDGAPAIAGGRGGITGDVHADVGGPTLAGGAYGGVLRDGGQVAPEIIASGRGGISGEV